MNPRRRPADVKAAEALAQQAATYHLRAEKTAAQAAIDAAEAEAAASEARRRHGLPRPRRAPAPNREHRGDAFKWIKHAQRIILDDAPSKLVLWTLASHAWASNERSNERHRALHGHVPGDGECTLLSRTLMRETGLSRRALFKALARLEEMGIIRREARVRSDGGQGASRYFINPSNDHEE